MARKRINVKAITILASLGVAGAGTAYGLKHFHSGNTKEAHVIGAEDAIRRGDIGDAIANYSAASKMDPKDVELHHKLAALLASQGEIPALIAAADEYAAAAAIDPKDKVAWEGMYNVYSTYLRYLEVQNTPRGRRELLDRVSVAREAAEHVAQLADAKDAVGQAAMPILMLRLWMLNFTLPVNAAEKDLPVDKRMTDDQRVEQAIAELTELSRKHPEESDFPLYIGKARMNQGLQALRTGQEADREKSKNLYAEAAASFDEAIDANKSKPAVLVALDLKKVELLDHLTKVDPDETKQGEYRAHIKDALDEASKLADPKTPQVYLTAKRMYASNLANSDSGAAEAVFRDLIRVYPTDVDLKVSLARLLRADISRLPDALKVLDTIKSTPPPEVVRTDLRKRWATEIYPRVRLLRAEVQVDQLMATSDPRQRAAIAGEIGKALFEVAPQFKEEPSYYRTLGRFQLFNHQTVDAIQTINLGVDKAKAAGVVDPELLRLQATAMIAGGQATNAKAVLEAAAQDGMLSRSPEIHTQLANIYLDENDLFHAAPQVKWLADRYPDNRTTTQLQIRALGPNPDPAVARSLYDRLPEVTDPDMRAKVLTAGLLKLKDEARRLLNRLLEKSPADENVRLGVVREELEDNNRDKALAIAKAGLPFNPDSPSLKIMIQEIEQGSGADPSRIIGDEIDKIKDPFDRAMAKGEFLHNHGDYLGELASLRTAIGIKPEDKTVNQRLFGLYLDLARFDDAAAMLPAQERINPDEAHGLMFKARYALAKRDAVSAIAFGRQLTAQYPEFSVSYQYLGDGYRISNQLQQAIDQYVLAMNKNSTNYDALNSLIDCYIGLGDPAGARRYVTDARIKYPGDLWFLRKQVEFEVAYGNPEPLLPELAKRFDDAAGNRVLVAIYTDALMAVRQRKLDAGNADDADRLAATAIAALRKAVEQLPDDRDTNGRLATVLAEVHDFGGAETVLKTFADRPLMKDKPDTLEMLGNFYFSQGKFDAAEGPFRRARDAAPKNLNFVLSLAQDLWAEGKQSEACVTILPACVRIGPRQLYCDWMIQNGKGEQAELETIDALKAHPEDKVNLTNLLIHVMTANGKANQALTLANEFIKQDPLSMDTYFLRGALEATSVPPDLDRAMKDLQTYRDAYPESPKGRVGLADVYTRSGEPANAVKELEVAVKLVPHAKQVRAALVESYLVTQPPQFAQAERFLNETMAAMEFRNDPDFKKYAARVALGLGDTDKALQLIREAIAAKPGAYADDYMRILLEAQNYQLLYDEANKLAASPNAGYDAYEYRAVARGKLGDLNGATDDFNAAMDKVSLVKDNQIGVATNLAMMSRKVFDVDHTIDLLKGRANNSLTWRLVLMDQYQNAHRFAEGLEMATAALQRKGDLSTNDRRTLSRAAIAMSLASTPPNYDTAEKLLRDLMVDLPDDIALMNDLACVLDDSPTHADPKQALPLSQKAYELSIKSGYIDGRIYDTYGWTLILNDKPLEGMDVLRRLGLDKADFPEAHYHMAMGYLKSGQPENAKRELDRADGVLAIRQNAHDQIDPTLVKKIEDASKEADAKIASNNPNK